MKTVLKRIIADFHRSPLPEFRRRVLDVPSNLAKIIVIVGPHLHNIFLDKMPHNRYISYAWRGQEKSSMFSFI